MCSADSHSKGHKIIKTIISSEYKVVAVNPRLHVLGPFWGGRGRGGILVCDPKENHEKGRV